MKKINRDNDKIKYSFFDKNPSELIQKTLRKIIVEKITSNEMINNK